MEKFKEKRIVNVLNNIGLSIFFCCMLSLVLAMFNPYFLIGFLFFPLPLPFLLIASSLSKINKYSREFIAYMQGKLKSAETLEDLISIKKEFDYLAVENGVICLSYPVTMKEINHEIVSKIDILQKLSGKLIIRY